MPVLDCGVAFKEYQLDKVQALNARIAEMDALSLNYLKSFKCYDWLPGD